MREYTGALTQVSYGEEWPDYIDLAGASFATRTISSLSGLTADKYNGQLCFIHYRGGNADGKVYHVVSNTTTSITFQESVVSPVLQTSDAISITTHGQLPASTAEYFGDIEDSELPERKMTPKEHFIHGSAYQPERKNVSMTKVEYTATMPVQLLNGKLLVYALGYVQDKASNFAGGDTTLARDCNVGETIIEVASATDFAVDDYIQIGTTLADSGEGTEIRKITAISTVYFTLDKPLRRYHEDYHVSNNPNSKVREVDVGTGKPVTHRIKADVNQPTFTLETVFKNIDTNYTGNDVVIHYTGLHGNSLSFKSAEETLSVDIGVAGLNALKNQRTRATVDTSDWTQEEYLYADSEVSVNGIVYSAVENLDYGTDRNLKGKYYHNKDTGINPNEQVFDGFAHKCKMDIPFHNMTFWDLVNDKTEFDAYTYYERDSTDDYLKLYFDNNKLVNAPLPFAPTEIIQTLEYSVGQFYIDVVDTIEYY